MRSPNGDLGSVDRLRAARVGRWEVGFVPLIRIGEATRTLNADSADTPQTVTGPPALLSGGCCRSLADARITRRNMRYGRPVGRMPECYFRPAFFVS